MVAESLVLGGLVFLSTFRHKHDWALPVTLEGSTYQRCLRCSRRREYDQHRMRAGRKLGREIPQHALAPGEPTDHAPAAAL